MVKWPPIRIEGEKMRQDMSEIVEYENSRQLRGTVPYNVLISSMDRRGRDPANAVYLPQYFLRWNGNFHTRLGRKVERQVYQGQKSGVLANGMEWYETSSKTEIVFGYELRDWGIDLSIPIPVFKNDKLENIRAGNIVQHAYTVEGITTISQLETKDPRLAAYLHAFAGRRLVSFNQLIIRRLRV